MISQKIIDMMESQTQVQDTLDIGYQVETKTHIYYADENGEVKVYERV
jgi:hypothetical protein